MKDFYTLTKPGITRMQLITVTIGYVLGSLGEFYQPLTYLILLLGTACVAAGAGALNHAIEKDVDAKMLRTKHRPVASGRVSSQTAIVYGLLLSTAGLVLLWAYTPVLSMALAALTILLYVAVYTPLKRYSWLNTFVGAIPGALPILGGWAAATGTLSIEAWILFIVLFTWQHPHFYALAIRYKDEYKDAGLQMLPVIDEDLSRTLRQSWLYTILMIISSLLPFVVGLSGQIYLIGMIILNLGMLWALWQMSKDPEKGVRTVFLASVIYLPLWLLFIMGDFFIN